MTDFQTALNEAKPLLLELFSPRCSHCVNMMPVVDELREKIGDKANIIQLEGRENKDLMRRYKVDAYPCWILFKDGQIVWRDYGEKPLSELEREVLNVI